MDKRTLLATGICMAIFLLWTGVISPMIWPPRKAPPAAAPAAAPATKPATTVQAAPVSPTEVQRADFAEEPPFRIQTKYLKAEFTNRGAGIRTLTLRYPDEASDVPMLEAHEPGIPHFALRHVDGPDRIETIPWKVEERKDGELIRFTYPLRSGLTIAKEFRVDPSTYTLKLTVSLNPPRSEDGKPRPEETIQLELLAYNGLEHESPYRYEQYFRGVALVGDDPDSSFDLGKVGKGEGRLWEAVHLPAGPDRDNKLREAWDLLSVTKTPRKWFGLRNRFFTTLLLPEAAAFDMIERYTFRASAANVFRTEKNINAAVRTVPLKISDKPVLLGFAAYAGPIQKDALEQMTDAPRLQTYGGGCILPIGGLTNMVGQVILMILKLFSGLLHNWGLGIIATTLLIRICIFPLSKKSQESAYKMQQLAPKIQELRARYKDDQQKFGLEQMRLFKEHKINPLSGCLPLFLQLPIFIGMFSVFDTSIELRGKPFFLWIRDLSRPDRLLSWHTPVNLPLLPTFDSFNLLPILMLITWFLQAYLAPRSPDPQMQQQQKMMLAMPIVFGLMCYNYAAGLSLYFLVNSGLAMIEQKVIKKYILRIPPGGAGGFPPNTGAVAGA